MYKLLSRTNSPTLTLRYNKNEISKNDALLDSPGENLTCNSELLSIKPIRSWNKTQTILSNQPLLSNRTPTPMPSVFLQNENHYLALNHLPKLIKKKDNN